MQNITIADFQKMVAAAYETISARAEEFSKLDAVLGDGDHGEAITTALKVIKTDSTKSKDFKTILGDMGFGVMLQTSGSTSTLLGGFLLGMADTVEGDNVTELDAKGLKKMVKGGLEGVQKNTKAQLGDKTIIDSLAPAVEAIENANSTDCKELLEIGAKAALEGAEKTKGMKANFGRARNLGDKSIGPIDPGALSWATIFDSFAKAL